MQIFEAGLFGGTAGVIESIAFRPHATANAFSKPVDIKIEFVHTTLGEARVLARHPTFSTRLAPTERSSLTK